MFSSSRAIVLILGLVSLSFWGCSSKEEVSENTEADGAVEKKDTATVVAEEPAIDPEDYVFEFAKDSREELTDDLRRIYAWYPKYGDKIDFAVKDVTHVTFLEDLKLGEIACATPESSLGAAMPGHSIRMNLPGEKTAFAFRFVFDTLPRPRVPGEGYLGLFSPHCSDRFGPNVDLERLLASTGRLGMTMVSSHVLGAMSCCEMPPTFRMDLYGDYGDTVAVVVTFNTKVGKHTILVMGPNGSRVYAGHHYGEYRTERGEFHRDLNTPPYYIVSDDFKHVNLLLGFGWRGRKSVSEPVLSAHMF